MTRGVSRAGLALVLVSATALLVAGLALSIAEDRSRPFELAAVAVSAVAAVLAAYWAADAAHEARSLRREERLARLPELVVEHAERLLEAYSSTYGGYRWALAHASGERLRVAIIASGEDLPASRALTDAPLHPRSEEARVIVLNEVGRSSDRGLLNEAVTEAMDELAAVLQRTR